MSKKRSGLRQEDHDPEQLRLVLDAAQRTELASFIQTAFHIVNPGVEYKHNYHIEAIAHLGWYFPWSGSVRLKTPRPRPRSDERRH